MERQYEIQIKSLIPSGNKQIFKVEKNDWNDSQQLLCRKLIWGDPNQCSFHYFMPNHYHVTFEEFIETQKRQEKLMKGRVQDYFISFDGTIVAWVKVMSIIPTIRGMERYDEISFALIPHLRGHGLGTKALECFLIYYRQKFPDLTLEARIDEENIISQKLFEKVGFRPRKKNSLEAKENDIYYRI